MKRPMPETVEVAKHAVPFYLIAKENALRALLFKYVAASRPNRPWHERSWLTMCKFRALVCDSDFSKFNCHTAATSDA